MILKEATIIVKKHRAQLTFCEPLFRVSFIWSTIGINSGLFSTPLQCNTLRYSSGNFNLYKKPATSRLSSGSSPPKEDILRHRLFIDSDQMPTWVHYCFCLIMQLVYIPVDSPGLWFFDCWENLFCKYMYVFMAFLLSLSGMFNCDRHFQIFA